MKSRFCHYATVPFILSLADVRRASGQRCSRLRAGGLGVLAAVRRPRGQPQAAVLPNPPRPAGGPPRCGPEARRVGDFWSSSSRRPFGLAGRPRPRCRSPGVRSRRPHPRIPVRGFVAAEPASRPARPSRRVRRTASARLSPLGARPSRPLLTQLPSPIAGSSLSSDGRRCSRSGGAGSPWPGGADSRTGGAQGSPGASVLALAEAYSAEGNASSRSID